MIQKLAVKSVQSVDEIEPAILEIVFILQDETTAQIRMNIFALRSLFEKMRPHMKF